jgi:arginase
MRRSIDVIGVPFDLGGGKSGVDSGPEALVASGFLSVLQSSGHNVSYRDLSKISACSYRFSSLDPPQGKVQYLKELIYVLESLCVRTFASLRVGHAPIILGGDHSIAIGSIGAALAPGILDGKRLGVVWIDAHYDAHTAATTSSGHANGMPLATLLGRGTHQLRRPIGYRSIRPEHLLHIGAGKADCEPEEIALFAKLGIPCFDQERLQSGGWMPVYQAIRSLALAVDYIWVSFDIDSVNERWAPGVAFPNKFGIDDKGLFWLADRLALTGKVIGADIVEHTKDREKYDAEGRPKTAMLATEFARRILK